MLLNSKLLDYWENLLCLHWINFSFYNPTYSFWMCMTCKIILNFIDELPWYLGIYVRKATNQKVKNTKWFTLFCRKKRYEIKDITSKLILLRLDSLYVREFVLFIWTFEGSFDNFNPNKQSFNLGNYCTVKKVNPICCVSMSASKR